MKRSQANRAVVAARAANRPGTRPATVGTNPALRLAATVVVTGPGPRKGRAKGGGMVSVNGRMSDWHQSQNLRPCSTPLTSAWDQTVSNTRI